MNKLAEPQTYGFLMVPERGNKNILLNCLFSLQIHLSLLKRIFKNTQWGLKLYEVAFKPLHLYHQLYTQSVPLRNGPIRKTSEVFLFLKKWLVKFSKLRKPIGQFFQSKKQQSFFIYGSETEIILCLATLELWLPDKYSFVAFLLPQKTNLTIF